MRYANQKRPIGSDWVLLRTRLLVAAGSVATLVLAAPGCTTSVTRFVYLETESRISQPSMVRLDEENPQLYGRFAKEIGGRITVRGGNRYYVGIDLRTSEDSANFGAVQKQPSWCWAAAVETVLRSINIRADQCSIVERLKGSSCNGASNGTGSYKDVVDALKLYDRGPGGWLHAFAFRPTMQDLVRELAHGRPFIMGLTVPKSPIGHVYVVTGMTFRLLPDPRDAGGFHSSWPTVIIETLELYNPLPDENGRHFERKQADPIEPMVTMLVPLQRT